MLLVFAAPTSLSLGKVTEWVERRSCVKEIRSSVPCGVKRMTYKTDTCHFLAWRSALIGLGKDWLAQCQDNVTKWDIGSWCQWPDF